MKEEEIKDIENVVDLDLEETNYTFKQNGLSSACRPDDIQIVSFFQRIGVKLTGTAGILINAKMKGLIEAISPYLDQLEDLGFHLAPEHKSLILKKAGEE